MTIRVYDNDTLYSYFTARRQGRTCFSNITLYIHTMTDSFVGDVVIVLWVNVLCFFLADFGALTHLAL